MTLSPESASLVEQLCSGGTARCEGKDVGPLTQAGISLLRVLVADFDRIEGLAGASLATEVRRLYREHRALSDKGDAALPAQTNKPADGVSTPKAWRVHALRATSFRGLAPAGETVEFVFDSLSHLIYGPNGSGKSSLLGALIWALSGEPVSDADDPAVTAPVYNADGSSTLTREWPVVQTLMHPSQLKTGAATHVEIELRAGKDVLRLARTIAGGLTASTDDGVTWSAVGGLEDYGISPLDVQLSIVTPRKLSRLKTQDALNIPDILSSILGLDQAQSIGALVADKLQGACTRVYNEEQGHVKTSRERVSSQLSDVVGCLPSGHACVEKLRKVINESGRMQASVCDVGKQIRGDRDAADAALATLLGVRLLESEGPSSSISSQLVSACEYLGREPQVVFRGTGALRVSAILPPQATAGPSEQRMNLEQRFATFLEECRDLVAKRHSHYVRECVEGKWLTLAAIAAPQYEVTKSECPLCHGVITDKSIQRTLVDLQLLDPRLAKALSDFFAGLQARVGDILPKVVTQRLSTTPGAALRQDWSYIKDQVLGRDLRQIAEKWDEAVELAATSADTCCDVGPPDIIPKDADKAFREASEGFIAALASVQKQLAVLRWGDLTAGDVFTTLHGSLLDTSDASLLGCLAKGRATADSIAPLNQALAILKVVYKNAGELDVAIDSLELMQEVRDAVAEVKPLQAYIAARIGRAMEEYGEAAQVKWRAMYDEAPSGLMPGGVAVTRGKAKRVEARLTGSDYSVSCEPFANAGLQRAVNLACFFSVLERHPGGLGFVVLDDPLLSLDEEHRERWTRELVVPIMASTQVILGTHLREYLQNCQSLIQGAGGRTVELNLRRVPARLSWRPSCELAQAKRQLEAGDWGAACNWMRKYVEAILDTLNSYAETPFRTEKLRSSIEAYKAVVSPSILVGGRQQEIANALLDARVDCVLNPGSHHSSQARVTDAMARDAHAWLNKAKRHMMQELERLEKERERRMRGSVTEYTAGKFGNVFRSWGGQASELPIAGRAAAKTDCIVMNGVATPERLILGACPAIIAASDVLEPVAYEGDVLLLDPTSTYPREGDLVAVETSGGYRLLRRFWSDGDRWLLQSANPTREVPVVALAWHGLPVRRVIGVLFTRGTLPHIGQAAGEWEHCSRVHLPDPCDLALVQVEGESLNPVARAKQWLMIGRQPVTGASRVDGMLVAVSTDSEHGDMVKRVYSRKDGTLTLVSTNPVLSIAPIVIEPSEVRRMYRVVGVLFEVPAQSGTSGASHQDTMVIGSTM